MKIEHALHDFEHLIDVDLQYFIKFEELLHSKFKNEYFKHSIQTTPKFTNSNDVSHEWSTRENSSGNVDYLVSFSKPFPKSQ